MIQASPATSQILTPRAQAARNADSLRVLPVVRQLYAAERERTAALTLQATTCAEQAQRLSADVRETHEEVVNLRLDVDQAQGKATRRGWLVAGLLAGLAAVVGLNVAF